MKTFFAAMTIATLSFSVNAQVFTEATDASALLASATSVPAGTTQIDGDITNSMTDADVDVFRINVVAAGDFTVEAIADVDGSPDMNLLIFNANGQALAGDDDDDESCTVITVLDSLDSCQTLTLAPGDYFVAVGDNNIGAFQSVADYMTGGLDFFDNDSSTPAMPTPEIAVIVGTEGGPDPSQTEGPYVINFSAAVGTPGGGVAGGPALPVPTSSWWALVLLVGLLSWVGIRRARNAPLA